VADKKTSIRKNLVTLFVTFSERALSILGEKREIRSGGASIGQSLPSDQGTFIHVNGLLQPLGVIPPMEG
jgi:hypothetical protein